MNDIERRVLSALRFDWAPTREDVWAPLKSHVEAMNGSVADDVLSSFAAAKKRRGRSPLGVVIMGQKGAGKTHMLCWLREQVQNDDGYFFLVGLLHRMDFWRNIVYALVLGLRQRGRQGDDQLSVMLARLCDHINPGPDVRDQIAGVRPLTRQGLDQFINALRRKERHLGRECLDTARALVLLGAAGDFDDKDAGEAYLTSQEETDQGEWKAWGIRSAGKGSQQIVSEISRILALTGPSLLAIDQIDTLIAQSRTATTRYADAQIDIERDPLLEQIGGGLMDLREVTHRTLTVVACLNSSWELVRERAVATVSDRFRAAWRLERIPSAEVGRELVAARFSPQFQHQGFVPPFDTWPVLPEAFADVPRFTPRGLFKRIDAHIRACLRDDEVTLLAKLDELPEDAAPPEPPDVPAQEDELARFDRWFASLEHEADTAAALDSKTEDAAMPLLLRAGLHAWMEEQVGDRELYSIDPPPGARPAFHARLQRTIDELTMNMAHWSFRAIAGPHHSRVLRALP